MPTLQATFPTALPLRKASIVLPAFARSGRLTLVQSLNILLNNTHSKSGQRPVRKPGQGVLPCGGKVFSDLMFGYFASKVK